MRKINLLCALLLALALCVPALAEVQSVKVGGDITIYGLAVKDYDQNDSNTAKDNTEYFMTITKLRFDADMTDNVAATIGLINERTWDVETTTSTDLDLDLSYVTMKEMLYSPLTLTVGRQHLRFGNALIVGDPDTNGTDALCGCFDLSQRKSFDAIRANFNYDPMTLDVIYAVMDEVTKDQDKSLLGLNLGMPLTSMDAKMEAYLFGVIDKSVAPTKSRIYVLGVNGSLVPVEDLTVSGEIAYQFGDYTSSRDRAALAIDLGVSFAIEGQYSPVLGAKYAYRSGDKIGNTGDYEAWDPLFEDQSFGGITNYTLTGLNNGQNSNCHIIGLSGSIKPSEQLALTAELFHYLLAEKTTAIGSLAMNSGKDALGDEIDLTLTYAYSNDVQLGLMLGTFIPGDAFDGANDDSASFLQTWVALSF